MRMFINLVLGTRLHTQRPKIIDFLIEHNKQCAITTAANSQSTHDNMTLRPQSLGMTQCADTQLIHFLTSLCQAVINELWKFRQPTPTHE